MKAVKGNEVLISDKTSYYEIVNISIPYTKVRKNRLPKFVSEVKNILIKCNKVITSELNRRLLISNSPVPKLYCFLRIHKATKSK